MELIALPAFADNYIWMLHDGHRAVVVDPGEARPVIEALDTLGRTRALDLVGILVTHHHGDHVGGLDDLRPRLRGPVFGPRRESIPQPYQALEGGDRAQVLGLNFEVIDVPGHTAGHIAYFAHVDGQAPLLFCGDTLFSAGCGRLFEGTPAQMHASLSHLATLPGDTRVCCAHEYTLSNLRFAHAVEPGNAQVTLHTQRCETLRAADRPTLPSSIALELQINPFMRCSHHDVIASARQRGAAGTDAVDVLAAIRQWKNEFR